LRLGSPLCADALQLRADGVATLLADLDGLQDHVERPGSSDGLRVADELNVKASELIGP